MTSNLKVNNILPSTGTTVAVSGIASVTSSVSIASSCTATTFYGSGANLTGVLSDLVEDTSPQLAANLDVNGANILFGDSSAAGINLNRLKFGAGTDLHIWHNSGTGNSNISNYNGNLYIQGNNGSGTGVNQIAILSNAAVELNYQGNKKLETTNTGVSVTGNLAFSSGSGIDFSATGNISGTSSELLDDYEEGSWTPVVGGWDTFTPYSGSSYYQGWYVKVGGMVHCGWKIYIQHLTTPATSGSQHVRISGLPFTSRAVAAGPVAVMRFDIVETGITNNQWNYMGGNSDTIYLYKQTNGGNGANAINASQNYSNMWTMGTATYATDS